MVIGQKQPLISVIVPIYNTESYLRRCLDSLCSQTYENLEILLVDDGSSDGSARIAEAFTRQDPRFRYFYQKNSGAGAARNTGLDRAKGAYLSFVDSDDWVSPDFIEKLYGNLQLNHADICCCSAVWAFPDGSRKIYRPMAVSNQVFTDISDFLRTVSDSPVNKLYARELFENLRFPVGIIFEDYATIPLACARAKKAACIGDVLYYYFWRENSTIHSPTSREDVLKAHERLEQSDLGETYPDILELYLIKNILGLYCYSLGIHHHMDRVKTIWESRCSRYSGISRRHLRSFVKILPPSIGVFAFLVARRQYGAASVYLKVVPAVSRLRSVLRLH